VNTSSELALCGAELHAHYCAAKGAIVGLTKSLALELAGRGVRVNAVAPGATDTALLTDTWRTREYVETLPLRRLSEPVQIAATVTFLASDAAGYVTGQVLSPNSGAVI
jgi:2-hydroxycyclohexanecarboxyl-CoA dehydrogenase